MRREALTSDGCERRHVDAHLGGAGVVGSRHLEDVPRSRRQIPDSYLMLREREKSNIKMPIKRAVQIEVFCLLLSKLKK